MVGIALAAASVVIMPSLSLAQRRTGRALASGSVVADSKQTLLCTYLSAVPLVGLVLIATLGWFWADPLAGLVIAAVAAREGVEAWPGGACSCAATGLERHDTQANLIDDCGCGCGPDCTEACCATTAKGRGMITGMPAHVQEPR